MASPADGVQQAPVAKPQKVLRPLHFVLPVLASIAHAYWLASLKAGVVAEFAASPDGTLSIPWRVPVAIGALYVAGVLLGVRVFKAREGQKKPAAQISEAMVVYNIYASVLSLYMGAGMFLESIAAGRGGFTATMDKVHGGELCWLLYANMMSKFLEYLDTVFMIVKYNWRQITFLHVSHHAEMGWVIWVALAYYPGGQSYWGPMINSFVHTVMYAYYAASAAGLRWPGKRIITQMQLVQFVLVMIQAVYHLLPWNRDVYWPSIVAIISSVLMVQMILMFSNFYGKAYSGEGDQSSAAPAKDGKKQA